MAASENLSGAAILIFRRYFKSSSLSVFCKIGIPKTGKFLGEHIYAGVSFQYSCRPLAWNFIKLENSSWIFFNESCKIFILRTHFLQDSSERLLLIFRKLYKFFHKSFLLVCYIWWCPENSPHQIPLVSYPWWITTCPNPPLVNCPSVNYHLCQV